MAYKSLSADLKLVRNQIQDNTASPYANSNLAAYPSTSKYVFAFFKKPASSTATDSELYDRSELSKLPVIVTVTHIANPPHGNLDGSTDLFGVLIRVFAAVGTKLTFKTVRMEAEELALEKVNEIAYEFKMNLTVQAALAAQGLVLQETGGARQIDSPNRQDFGYATELNFLRQNTS